ncbi:MAG: cell division protein ZapB [Treponema sp.]|jgi:chromosome segregation ATPase|nr:cell division protein ZapB [Treponema sp.]
MISLDKIQLLEQKIEIAVGKIVRITEENRTLQKEYARMKAENEALRASLTKYQDEQTQIEQGILHVIDRLEAVESTILESVVYKTEQNQAPREPMAVPDYKVAEPAVPVQIPDQASDFEPDIVESNEAAKNPEPEVSANIDDFEIIPELQTEQESAFSFMQQSDSENGQLDIF